MSIFASKGEEAAKTATQETSAAESPIVSFKSGTTYKVGVKSANDVAKYFGYGVYKKVNTFVPKNPSKRNARGFVESDHTVWDRASELLYADAKAAEEAGAGKDEVEKLRNQAYELRGKPRFLRAFFDLTTGKDIVVDLTPAQERAVQATIDKYKKRLDKLAFELSKQGQSTTTTVTLSPIIDMDEDLTEEERTNFAKLSDAPFDMDSFESCLYIADEDEQVKNLVVAGFDIGRLGLTIGATTDDDEGVTTIEDEAPVDDPTAQF